MTRSRPIRLSAWLLAATALVVPPASDAAQGRQPPSGKPAPYTLAGVDVFGNSRTPDSEILSLLAIQQGEEIRPEVVTQLDEKLRASGKFAYSKVSSAAYGDKKSYLTVDVVEKGEEARFRLNPKPAGDVAVPQEVLDWVRRYEEASFRMFQISPKRLKDIDEGHYLDSDPGIRQYEEKMLEMVPAHYDVLVKALQQDKDKQKRTSCATLLGWSKDKEAVIPVLEGALKDPDVEVRSSAARSLIPIAYLAAHAQIPFPLGPVLDQLSYPTSSDRTKALALLLHLAGIPKNHDAIRDRAGDLLVRMAGAKQPTQREHSLTLLAVISGENYGRDPEKWRAWWEAVKKGAPPPKSEPAKDQAKSGS